MAAEELPQRSFYQAFKRDYETATFSTFVEGTQNQLEKLLRILEIVDYAANGSVKCKQLRFLLNVINFGFYFHCSFSKFISKC